MKLFRTVEHTKTVSFFQVSPALICIEIIFWEKEIFNLIHFDTVSYLSGFLHLHGLILGIQAI